MPLLEEDVVREIVGEVHVRAPGVESATGLTLNLRLELGRDEACGSCARLVPRRSIW